MITIRCNTMKRTPKSKRPLAPKKLPPDCLCCGTATPWVTQTIPQTTQFRNQTHTVLAEVMQCRHCDSVITTTEQDAKLINQTRKEHSEWIKDTIQSARKALHLSHRNFAEALNIGSATLSRAVKAESIIDASTEELLLFKIDQLLQNLEKQNLLNLKPQTFFSLDEKTSNLSGDWDDFTSNSPLALAG